MDTKEPAETAEPSVAPAKPAPEPTPAGVTYLGPVPSVPLSGTKGKDNSLESSVTE